MLRKEGYTAWDQLRLLDFGFAQCCSKGEFSCTHGWSLMTMMSESILPHAMFSARDCTKLKSHHLCQAHSKILFLSADLTVLDVNPHGATPAYAAPELLRSLQLQCQGAGPAEPGLLINGPSADWWAVGIVLFELLTGELPFRGKAATKAPEYINSLCKEQWEDYEGVLQAHQSWVSMPLLTASHTSSTHSRHQMIACV